jgi:sigma-B regulation protein RsbU (phosphoserine phosphatase)
VTAGPASDGRAARQVAVLATPAAAARAEALARALPGLLGGGNSANLVPLAEATPGRIADAAAAVALLQPGDPPHGLTDLLDAAEDARIGVLLLAGSPSGGAGADGGVIVESLDATDAAVAATLRGMLGRQREVTRLARELGVAGRFTGGLRAEIARMQEELRTAAEVQREFLPRDFPEPGDIRVSAFWRPAGYVSGDIYDVVALDERHLGVFLADAVGHGVPAALLTMVLCRGLPTRDAGHGSYRIVPPAEALARVNAELVRRQGRSTRFATAVYAVIDAETGEVRLASAGHPAPAILRAGGATEPVQAGGGLLGVFDGEEYAETGFRLEPGDRLAIHSDGFEQAFPGDPTGSADARVPTRRYVQELDALRGAPTAAAMTEQAGRRIDMQFGSVRQADDVTLLVVERLRGAAR